VAPHPSVDEPRTPIACVHCGRSVVGGRCPACDITAESRFVQRELVVLVVLGVVVTVGFLLTRTVARANHALRIRDGGAWFATGEGDLAAGQSGSAITALRRAVAIDRDNRQYRLALARALVAAGEDSGARQVLIGLRQSSPEDPEANLPLARLERRQGDAAAAMRYYQSALHGTWGADHENRRRDVRVEFVRYLLALGDRARALSELLVLSGNLPDDVAWHVEAAGLFRTAGDPARALSHFRRALRLDSTSRAALAGAGEAAFDLGDYAAARRFLRAARLEPSNPDFGRLSELLDVADLVLERDPLRPRLLPTERRQRVMADVVHVKERLDDCITGGTLSQPKRGHLASLRADLDAWEAQARSARDRSLDPIEAGLGLVHRVEQQTAECGPASPLDRALVLIAERHEIDRQ
jgi:tetratricopeptide (TPR) repeat protein